MGGLDVFHEQLNAHRRSVVVLLTKCLKEVLRDDDIAKDTFAVVSTQAVIRPSRSNKPWS
jgi:L-fucose isomerase-like protein